MANLTYRQALSSNELVASGAGAGQENIDGTQVISATGASPNFLDSGFTFNTIRDWVKLDSDWMSKSVYDSGGDGRVDNAEKLYDGSNTVTAAQARSHIDDTSIHFVINDIGTSSVQVWSSSKITSELAAKVTTLDNVGTGEGNVFQGKAGTTANLKTLKQAGTISITDNVNDVTISSDGEANVGANLGTGEGEVYEGKTGVALRLKTIKAGANIQVDNNASDVTINALGGTTDLTDAQFPTWAGFVNQGSTAISVGGTTNISFSASNKHALTGSGSTTIGTFTFPQDNAHYWITIPSTITIAGVSATNKQEYGTNDLTTAKAHVMAIYWDGTTAHWQTSEAP